MRLEASAHWLREVQEDAERTLAAAREAGREEVLAIAREALTQGDVDELESRLRAEMGGRAPRPSQPAGAATESRSAS